MEIKKIVKLLHDALTELQSQPAYERLVDITEDLFEDIDARVVIVMNSSEFRDLRERLGSRHAAVDGDVIKDMVCPHGEIDYVIIDNRVNQMYGYKT